MFYFFSKTLNYLLTPAGWLVASLLLGLITKNARHRRWLIAVGLAIFCLFGNSALTNELALAWEYPPAPVPADSSARVAVLLTGGMVNTTTGVPDGRFLLGPQADRAGQALYLYKTGVVQKILISGGPGNGLFRARNRPDEGQQTARFLIVAGVRAGDIVLEGKSRNTHENAQFSGRMLRSRFGTNRCVLVTSAAHMRRAVACFRKEQVQPTPFSGAFMGGVRSGEPGDYLLPNAQSFTDSFHLIREITGYGVYGLMGYL